jgi:hypothetical protein
MPNEFMVVGEHRDDASELLVKGADGHFYEYDPAHDRWEIFADGNEVSAEAYP